MQPKSLNTIRAGLSNCNPEPCEAQRVADIPSSIEDLERSVNRMSEAVQNLWGRLDRVLRSEVSNKVCDAAPACGECEISRSIRAEAQRLDELTQGIEKMLGLIEV